MLDLAVTILRYFFLILLFLFIFRLTTSMISELRRNADSEEPKQVPRHRIPPISTGGDGARLQVVSAGEEDLETGATFPLGEMTKLGRGAANHIVFHGSFASQDHARIVYRQNQYWLEDLGSLNMTYLNDLVVKKPTVLANGDRIRIGEVNFRFVRWAYEMESDN